MNALRHHLRVYRLLTLFSFKKQLAYRASFFIAILAKFLRIGVYLLLFESLLLYTDILGGFGHEAVVVHYFTAFTVFLIATSVFQRNLVFHLSRCIKTGDLDGMLTKPIHPLFHVTFYEADLYDLTMLAPVIGILAYVISQVQDVTLTRVILYVLALGVGLLFLLGTSVLFSSLSFRIIESRGVGRILHAIFSCARYPATAFGDGWAGLFLYVFPVGFIATLPTMALTGAAGIQHIVYGIVFTVVLLLVSAKIWMRALKKYSSASS